MLLYNINVHGGSDDDILWDMSLRYDRKKIDDTKIARIHSIIDSFAETLKQLKAPVENPVEGNSIQIVKNALFDASLQLSSLHGLIAADGEAPNETFPIDNLEITQRLNAAVRVLDALEHNHNSGCP